MIDNETKEKLKKCFKAWCDLNDEKKEIATNINNILKEVEILSKIKKTKIRKAFSYLRRLQENGDNELQEINDIFSEIK